MFSYIVRRLLIIIPTILLLTVIIFFLVRMIPGSIVQMIQGTSGGIEIDVAQLEHTLGLDEPPFVQYGRWMGFIPQRDGGLEGILQGNLGHSWSKQLPVTAVIGTSWYVTLELGFLAILVALLIALPIGILSALRQDTWGDYLGRSFAILAISIPGFWLGTMIIVYPSIWWGYMPSIMVIKFFDNPLGNLKMFMVPAVVLGMAMSGLIMRMTRTMMLEVLRQDYIRTAWSKGLKEIVIIVRHALKNALIPVVTLIGLYTPVLFGGSVIIEEIFVLPGMGRLMIQALNQRDHPLLTGIVLFFSVMVMLVNIIVDVSYRYLDPRIQFEK